MTIVIDDQLVVNFVGENYQVMLTSEFRNLLQHLARADRSRGIVGIDQNDPTRPRRDLSLDVVEVGLPAVLFFQVISVQSNLDLRQNRGVERIIRARRQQVVAGIEQRAQTDVHRLADTRSDKDILNGRDTLARRLAANRFQSLRDAGRWRVSVLPIAHGFVDRFDQMCGSLKIEVERIADIERKNFVSLLRDFIGDAGQVANGVPDVFKAGGRSDFAGLSDRHIRFQCKSAVSANQLIVDGCFTLPDRSALFATYPNSPRTQLSTPNKSQSRQSRLRDGHCRWPWCLRKAGGLQRRSSAR